MNTSRGLVSREQWLKEREQFRLLVLSLKADGLNAREIASVTGRTYEQVRAVIAYARRTINQKG